MVKLCPLFSCPQYLENLWQQIAKLRRDEWVEKIIMRPYMAFHSILSESSVHSLPPFTPPPHILELNYPIPKVVFRMFDPTDAPDVSAELDRCFADG